MICSRFDEKTFEALATRGIDKSECLGLFERKKISPKREIKPARYARSDLTELSITGEYISPLRTFRSYRFSPYFRRQSLDIASKSISHKLNPTVPGKSFILKINFKV